MKVKNVEKFFPRPDKKQECYGSQFFYYGKSCIVLGDKYNSDDGIKIYHSGSGKQNKKIEQIKYILDKHNISYEIF